MEPPTDLITPDEAAQLLRCHRATIYRLIGSGRLTAWKRGRRKFVSRAEALAQITLLHPPVPLVAESSRRRTARDRRTEEVLRREGMIP